MIKAYTLIIALLISAQFDDKDSSTLAINNDETKHVSAAWDAQNSDGRIALGERTIHAE